jgi:hypothetical protein
MKAFRTLFNVFSSQKFTVGYGDPHVDPCGQNWSGCPFMATGEAWYYLSTATRQNRERLARLKHHLEKKDVLLIGQTSNTI